MNAFYEQIDDRRFRASVATTGPWDPRMQHGGPVAALAAGQMSQAVEQPLVRLTFELLRPVPVATLDVEVEVTRPGRAVTLVSATLADEDGPCVLARAWGIRSDPHVGFPAVNDTAPTMSPPDAGTPAEFFEVAADVGWHTAMELRFVDGSAFAQLGPARMWARPRMPLVAGRELAPIERVLLTADAGNGASASADLGRWMFVNTDLTVHLSRHPVGEWIGLDAHSVYAPHGVGFAATVIHDEQGPIGRGAQALFCGPQRG